MSNVYISVISHAHCSIINQLNCLNHLSLHFNVVIKSNFPGDDFTQLVTNNDLIWINQDYNLGFGQNNNYVFNYCKKELGMQDNDYFIVLNPDVFITVQMLEELICSMEQVGNHVAAINLFKDFHFKEYDNSIRRFPSLKDFIMSYIFNDNATVFDKSNCTTETNVDWAAGSFLAFNSGLYSKLKGFDEAFFMYCEDIDICKRSNVLGFPVVYYPYIKAMHVAKHSNQLIFSKHFFWHLMSILRYLLRKY